MGNGETQFVWVRLIKPGMEERVEEDLKIFKEIVPEIEAHPDVKDTFIEKIGNSVNALGRGVQIEADTGITANNQAEGVRAYSGKKNWALPGGKKIGVEVVVPEILNQSSADSGVHIQSVARGIKLGTLLGNDPLTYRAITKNLARMWLHEALFGSGFFHTDLHPGNIMASRDRSGNVSLTILDFGMADRLDPKLRGEFMKMTVAVDHKDVNGILDSLRSLLQEPIPDGKLREVVKQALAEDPSNYNVMKAVFKQGGTFADSFTNFTRGLWFVQQMLSKSGSPHKVEELIGKEAVKQLLAEVPKRAGQVVTLDLDSRPEAGVPLTNREVGKAANLYIRRCIKRSLESLKSTGRE
jgi:predicted unusual protein kinase regulating ubiquinone biosynthesis (AarF/ABC1/UbiB family)